MWKKFKRDIFVTSFIPLWLSIVVTDIWSVALFVIDDRDGKGKFVDNPMYALCGSIIQLVSIAIITILVLVSITGINAFLSKKLPKDGKHLPEGTVKRATKASELSSKFLLTYVLPMIAFDFSNLQDLTSFIIYFSVLAFLRIGNNDIYMNILLKFKEYRIYTCNPACRVIENDHTHHGSTIISKIDLTQERSAV